MKKNKINIWNVNTNCISNLGLNMLLIIFISISGCKKLIDIPAPKNSLLIADVFKDSSSVQAALNGMYAQMYNSFTQGQPYGAGISFLPGMSSDEIISDPTFNQFQKNNILPGDGFVNAIWAESYATIYRANSIIEGVSGSAGISVPFKNHAIGEAKFMRAFCYFYLVNFFGDVPLLATTRYAENVNASRAAAVQVNTQIINDLIDAQKFLPADYNSYGYGNERTRANQWAATALLARMYLYQGNWANAETESSKIINNAALYNLPAALDDVFLASSSEAIWQFNSNVAGFTWISSAFLPFFGIFPPQFTITNSLNSAFETGDNRKVSWTASHPVGFYPSKYKSSSPSSPKEYDVVLRLAEQYLIRAEARAQQNNIIGAQADINIIRNRAGLLNTTANNKAALLLTVENERRVELFTEWGHRWFDLKRTNRVNAVVGALKASDWQATDALYPIPDGERGKNPNLSQNNGY